MTFCDGVGMVTKHVERGRNPRQRNIERKSEEIFTKISKGGENAQAREAGQFPKRGRRQERRANFCGRKGEGKRGRDGKK